MNAPVPHVIGIDWGSRSLGFAAIETTAEGAPVSLLAAVSHLHDGGIADGGEKTSLTRVAQRGMARRHRRNVRAHRQRLRALDRLLEKEGLPRTDFDALPFGYPWEARARLATEKVTDAAERDRLLAISVRHIANFRGARNTWRHLERFLSEPYSPSDAHTALITRLRERGHDVPDDLTQAQAVMHLGDLSGERLRKDSLTRAMKAKKVADKEKPARLLDGRFMAADHLHELRVIAATQGLPTGPDTMMGRIERTVFEAGDPRGGLGERIGVDMLARSRKRTLRASESFQKYRIASVLANVRVQALSDPQTHASLSAEQIVTAYNLLSEWSEADDPTWSDVAAELGLEAARLRGIHNLVVDGEPVAGARPPTNRTNRRIVDRAPARVRDWWLSASEDQRRVLVASLCDTVTGELIAEHITLEVGDLLGSLSDAEVDNLSKISLESGRSAYSAQTCDLLTAYMLEHGCDASTARSAVFGLDPTWVPPAPAIHEPTGNLAVDRVLKQVQRMLDVAERDYGPPTSVNIEHVRAAVMSVASAKEAADEDDRERARRERNNAYYAEMLKEAGIQPTTAMIRKVRMLERQNSQCAYCGDPISLESAQLDHIVPRRGVGSTNRDTNLIVTCTPCNAAKDNSTFATWLRSRPRGGKVTWEGIEQRIDEWNLDRVVTGPYTVGAPGKPSAKTGLTPYDRQCADYRKQYLTRLRRQEKEEPGDERGFESGAWMARELRRRIEAHYTRRGLDVRVRVYQGSITAAARHASGIDDQLHMIGGHGKQRLDRRHHAVDAAVIAMMRTAVATVLAERAQLRAEEKATGNQTNWRVWDGQETNRGNAVHYRAWIDHMHGLVTLLNDALENDGIALTRNIHMRPNAGRAHADTIEPCEARKLGAAFTVTDIMRASTPALYRALVALPDYDPTEGLPENPDRRLRMKRESLSAQDTVRLFPPSSSGDLGGTLYVAVRHGCAAASDNISHARVYAYPKGKKTVYGWVRVLGADLSMAHGRPENPLTRPLTPDMTSYRYAAPAMRQALEAGTATYLGSLFVGDELQLAVPENVKNKSVQVIISTARDLKWEFAGYFNVERTQIRSRSLASEGLDKDNPADADLLEALTKQIPVAINPLCSEWRLTVVRRDPLGRIRTGSKGGWSVEANP